MKNISKLYASIAPHNKVLFKNYHFSLTHLLYLANIIAFL